MSKVKVYIGKKIMHCCFNLPSELQCFMKAQSHHELTDMSTFSVCAIFAFSQILSQARHDFCCLHCQEMALISVPGMTSIVAYTV